MAVKPLIWVNGREKTQPKCEEHHPLGWGVRLNIKERARETPALISLCFPVRTQCEPSPQTLTPVSSPLRWAAPSSPHHRCSSHKSEQIMAKMLTSGTKTERGSVCFRAVPQFTARCCVSKTTPELAIYSIIPTQEGCIYLLKYSFLLLVTLHKNPLLLTSSWVEDTMGILTCPVSQMSFKTWCLNLHGNPDIMLWILSLSVQKYGQSSHIFPMGLTGCHSLFMAWSLDRWPWEMSQPASASVWSISPLGPVLMLHSVMPRLCARPHPRPACHCSLHAETQASFVPALESTAVAFPGDLHCLPVRTEHLSTWWVISDSPRGSILENWIESWW